MINHPRMGGKQDTKERTEGGRSTKNDKKLGKRDDAKCGRPISYYCVLQTFQIPDSLEQKEMLRRKKKNRKNTT